jgi:hypothetical protein
MAELETKPCGWKIDHLPHHIVQHSSDSFNCPGYDSGIIVELSWPE